MAEKRMFSKAIIDSDAFLDMPLSTQALYFHLAMRADDDGFLNNAQKIMRMVKAEKADLDSLLVKQFLIAFPNGIYAITHWRIHNYLRSDRYKPTVYEDEKAMLRMKESGAYILETPVATDAGGIPVGIPNGDGGIPTADVRLTQISIDKDSVGKESIGEDNISNEPAPRHTKGPHGYVKLTDDEYSRLIKDLGRAEVDRVIAYVDESAATTENKNKWKDWNLVLRKASREKWGARGGIDKASMKRGTVNGTAAEKDYSTMPNGYASL